MKGSLVIVGFFVLGIVVGLTHVLPPMSSMGNVSYLTLCALIFIVGFLIGNDAEIFKKFKKLNRLYMLLPLMTIVGTLAGCAITTLLLPHRSLSECLAVGSGMGYYSLSSNTKVPTWGLWRCWPISFARSSPCWARPSW